MAKERTEVGAMELKLRGLMGRIFTAKSIYCKAWRNYSVKIDEYEKKGFNVTTHRAVLNVYKTLFLDDGTRFQRQAIGLTCGDNMDRDIDDGIE